MRIQITLNIPPWTKWVIASGAVGLVLGVGATRVFADQVKVKTDWADGVVLTAADLNANFTALKAAIDRLKHPDCPEDYVKDSAAPATITVCKKGVDEVVRIGTGGSAFWIDRYESGIFAAANGTGTQYGLASAAEFPASFAENGEYASPLYAVSVTGKKPSAYLTWFQAQAACRVSGKRLPTGEEWIIAAKGTTDPGPHIGEGGFCVTNTTGPRNTGGGTACVSAWGAQDMIGNLWEWTADWQMGAGSAASTAVGTWPRATFFGDGTWNIGSSAWNGEAAATLGVPAAVFRGGDYSNQARAGRFTISANAGPAYAGASVGFRCVVPQ